jgi:iron complex outermembrane receptor protein
VLKFNRVLPNVGFTADLFEGGNLFANYSKGLQVPGTDNLYQYFFFPANTAAAIPSPETTDNFDLGLRYNRSGFQAHAGVWYTKFKNRLASAYDPVLDVTVYRNLGQVDRYGVDGDISYRPIPEVSLRVFGSYLWSDIKTNVQLSGGGTVDCGSGATAPVGCALTAGRRESGAPVGTLGGSIRGNWGPISGGVQAKYTGKRYINDQNLALPLYKIDGTPSATVPAYTLVDLDLRVSLDQFHVLPRSFVQFNITNLFDEVYVGGFGGGLSATSTPFVQIGAPRAFILSFGVGF